MEGSRKDSASVPAASTSPKMHVPFSDGDALAPTSSVTRDKFLTVFLTVLDDVFGTLIHVFTGLKESVV